MEIWDAYKGDGTLAGCDLVRGEQIPHGLHHAVAEVLVLHTDDTVLITQRDFNKPNYPGLYESGAGGSVLKGETFLEGAIRELKEETGIYCVNLNEIYTVTTNNTIFKGYMCVVDIDKESITLQEGETIAYQWITKKEFMNLCKSELFIPDLKNRLNEFIESHIME
jgi:8-oxo-dGTP pyrophosphatase MutT (NUDIX family)